MKRALFGADRALGYAALAGAGLWVALALTHLGGWANGVRFGSPWWDYAIGQTLLFSAPAQAPAIIGMAGLVAAAVCNGNAQVVRPIWGGRDLAAPVWLVFAGFVPGYYLIIAATRIVTLVAPNSLAPGILLAALFAAAGACGLTLWRARAPGAPVRRSWIVAGVSALGFALVFQVQYDIYHALGDGAAWFVKDVFLNPTYGLGSAGHWPIFGQHYDEATFLYPIVMGLMKADARASETLTILYWILNAFGRVSVLSLLYVALRALKLDRLSALALLIFLAGAALSINPLSGFLLFDSLSPLGYVLHQARALAAIFPIIIVAAAAQAGGGRLDWRALGLAALLGIGLAATPIHGALLAPWAIALAALTAINPGFAARETAWRAACVCGLIVLIGFSAAYAWAQAPAMASAGVLIASAFAGAGVLAWALWRERGARADAAHPRLPAPLVGAATLGFLAGLFLFGNSTFHLTHSALSHVWPWSQVVVADRLIEPVMTASPTLDRSPYCQGGYWFSYRTLAGHCGSLRAFADGYGLPLVVALGVLGWRLTRRARPDATSARQDTMAFWGLALCLLALPFAFVLFDFVAATDTAREGLRQFSIWARSRLVEPWFYGAIGFALILLLREAGARLRVFAQSAMLAAAALFTLNPLVLPAQITANVAYLFTAAADWFTGGR